MSRTIPLEDLKETIPELLSRLSPGEEVVLTREAVPVARLVSKATEDPPKPRPAPGLYRGMILYMAPDFDEPLEDLREYME